jgi:hypothetical protein
VTALFPEPVIPGSEDHVFRELLVVVFNRILLRVQDLRLTEKELEEIGIMLRRTWIVARAYKEKKREYTISQWLERLSGLAREAGVPLP